MNTMNQDPTTQTLEESMLRLELALLSPVVSGELTSWVETVQEALAEFGPSWVAYVKSVLHPQYSEIAKTDPDLLPRVDQLIEEDLQLVADLASLSVCVIEFSKQAELVEKNETKAEEGRKHVERSGLDLIERIKRQQATASTWGHEANYRDRGVGG
jgi:hypothetical protein